MDEKTASSREFQTPISASSRSSGHILRASFIITGIQMLASMLGFLTNVILAASFGAGAEMDALLVSLTIPQLVLAAFAAATNFAVIPVLGDVEHRGDRVEFIRTTSILITTFGLGLAAISLTAWLASDHLVGMIAPGLPEGARRTAVALLAIQSPLILVSGLGSLLSSIHSSRHDYFHGPLAGLLGAVVMLASVFFLHRHLGIVSAAVGGLGSALVVFFLLLIPHLNRYPYRLIFSWQGSAALRILTLMAPLLLGAIVYRGDSLIQRFVAASLPTGSISCLGYAQKVISLFSTVLASGMPVVALSHFAASVRKDDKLGLAASFTSVFRWVIFLCVGSIGFIGICGRELIQIMFMRGHFDLGMTVETNKMLVLYSGVLFSGVVGTLITPVFYAHKDTRTVVLLGVSGTLLQIVLSFLLVRWLSVLGLPLAYSISNLAAVGAMFLVLRTKHLNFEVATILRFAIACLLAATFSVIIVRSACPEITHAWGVWASLIVKGLLMGGLYLGFSLLAGSLQVLAREHPRLKALNLPCLIDLC
jgi:putative peptidoglycan lipid II flippase